MSSLFLHSTTDCGSLNREDWLGEVTSCCAVWSIHEPSKFYGRTDDARSPTRLLQPYGLSLQRRIQTNKRVQLLPFIIHSPYFRTVCHDHRRFTCANFSRRRAWATWLGLHAPKRRSVYRMESDRPLTSPSLVRNWVIPLRPRLKKVQTKHRKLFIPTRFSFIGFATNAEIWPTKGKPRLGHLVYPMFQYVRSDWVAL